jgi:hypothetical protein
MKTVILAMAMLAGLTAQASDDMTCRSVNSGPDYGKILTISKTTQTASLTEETIAGPKPVQFGEMDCEFPAPPDETHPDQLVTYANCWTPHVADAGFNVTVTTGGIIGKTMAEVYELSKKGRTHIDTMFCESEDESQEQAQ